MSRRSDLERRDDDGEDRDFDGDDRRAHRNSAHRDWGMSLGAGGTVGAGQFPAKFNFDVSAASASCTADYVAFNTSLVGSATAPSIVAFNNLYSSQSGGTPAGLCGTAGPSVEWAYNTNALTDTTGQTLTSPVLSLDGTKIAFVESRSHANGGSILHILKWKPGASQGTIAAPATPDTTLLAGQAWNTTNCLVANSCVVNITYNGTQADTVSAPYYNYATDEAYVGDDSGVLHKFSGVFLGTPAEVVVGWPITVDAGAVLTSPVFDFTSKNIFVADSTGRVSFVMESGSTTGTCTSGSPPCLGSVSQALTGSIVDPPIVDSSTGRILIFDGTETATGNNGSVFQFDTHLSTGSKIVVKIGGNAVAATDVVRAGAFDDNYFTTGPSSGHLYTCGKDPGTNHPAIYQFSFDSSGNLLTTGIPAPLINLVNASPFVGDACSPVREIKNGTTDRIFFSIAGKADPSKSATGCTAAKACVLSIALPVTWPPAAATAGIAAVGGSSGIVVDNVGAGPQESSIYYTFQLNSTAAIPCNAITGVGCAVKVTQSTLQ